MTILKTFTANIAGEVRTVEQLLDPRGAASDNQRMRSQNIKYRFTTPVGVITLSADLFWSRATQVKGLNEKGGKR